MATQLFFADSLNITQSGNFKSSDNKIIKLPNKNKIQRNNSVLLARLLSITKMSFLLSKIFKVSNIGTH